MRACKELGKNGNIVRHKLDQRDGRMKSEYKYTYNARSREIIAIKSVVSITTLLITQSLSGEVCTDIRAAIIDISRTEIQPVVVKS